MKVSTFLFILSARVFHCLEWGSTKFKRVMHTELPLSMVNDTLHSYFENIMSNQKRLQQDHDRNLEIFDTLWLIITGVAVITMQLGFSMLEAGTVETKAVTSVLIKNLADAIVGGCSWLFLGFAISTSDSSFFGISASGIFPTKSEDFLPFFHSYGFSVTAVTIISGAVLGRVRIQTYIAFAGMFNALVYPPVALWGWGKNGFLNELGFIDFAGGMIVHGLGGVSALIGAWLVGSRPGRFHPRPSNGQKPLVRSLESHSPSLMCLGMFILYVNWFYFNAGSTLTLAQNSYLIASKVTMNTLVSSLGAGNMILLLTTFTRVPQSLENVVNSILSGLVAITPGCAAVDTIGAFIIGSFATVIYICSSDFLLVKCLIDDPLDASSVHGMVGIYGTLVLGLFSEDLGLLYGHGFSCLKVQILGAIAITCWAVFSTFVLLMSIKYTIGLRASKEEQVVGLDLLHHDVGLKQLDGFTVQEFNLRKQITNAKEKEARRGSSKRSIF